jgi:hypothetical protein
MPVNPGLTTTVSAGQTYYRITSRSFNTRSAAHHRKVVNGQGAVNSQEGARYNHGGVCSVYLAEDVLTCLAEKMFYFHREILRCIDLSHLFGPIPPFLQKFTLWEVEFKKAVDDVCELNRSNASAVGVYPSLMTNPSQDYHHLKDRRAFLQHHGYNGLRAPSSRVCGSGQMIVLFHDQTANVQRITPFEVELRLITSDSPAAPFRNHATEILDFTAGEVRIRPSSSGVAMSPLLAPYAGWVRVGFHH